MELWPTEGFKAVKRILQLKRIESVYLVEVFQSQKQVCMTPEGVRGLASRETDRVLSYCLGSRTGHGAVFRSSLTCKWTIKSQGVWGKLILILLFSHSFFSFHG